MKTLIVDDSSTIRTMLRRAVDEFPPADIVEAVNGLEALDAIARQRFDLVILDINMPVMDGLEALEAIRSSPEYKTLPVVVLTSEKGDAVVRRLVELGITDYLSKPLSRDTLAERLARIIGRLRAPAAHRAAHDGHAHRVLVVEQDPDRRHFIVTVLAPHFDVTAADSSAAALRTCMDPKTSPFETVLVGEQVGLPLVDRFLPKLRSLPTASGALVLGFHTRAKAFEGAGLFDDIVEWAYLPEVFLARFQRAATGATVHLTGLPAFRTSIERDTVAATEQLFGLMLSSEVMTVPHGQAPLHRWPGTGVHAQIDLRTSEGTVISVLFRADCDSARAITSHLIGANPADVHQDDVVATAAEFINIIVGRLRNRLVEAGIQTQMQLPRTWVGENTGSMAVPDVTLEFDSHRLGVSVGLLLLLGNAQVPEADHPVPVGGTPA